MKSVNIIVLIGLLCIVFFSCRKKPQYGNNAHRLCSNINPSFISYNGNDSAFFYFPNIFTPDGDGMNDEFRSWSKNIDFIDCRIKLGAITVYRTHNVVIKWNGEFNGSGNKMHEDDYQVIISGITHWGTTFSLKGTISLVNWNNPHGIINCDTCEFNTSFDGKGFITSPDSPRYDAIHYQCE